MSIGASGSQTNQALVMADFCAPSQALDALDGAAAELLGGVWEPAKLLVQAAQPPHPEGA